MFDAETVVGRRLIKAAVVAFGLFCVSAYKSWEEIRFWTSGISGTATITDINPVDVGYKVSYKFLPEKARRLANGSSFISSSEVTRYAIGDKVPILYYGEQFPASRLRGATNFWWISAFLGTMAATIGTVGWLAWQSRHD